MKTSNSSKQRNGDSIASHSAMMNDTVEKERSPPDRDRVSFEPFLEPLSTLTYKRDTERDTNSQRPRALGNQQDL